LEESCIPVPKHLVYRHLYIVLMHPVQSFIHQWLYSPLLGPGLFCFVLFSTQTVGLLGRVISPSQGRYVHTGQHKHRINAHADIHALSGIQTHTPSVRASEDSSCVRPHGHCDRQASCYINVNTSTYIFPSQCSIYFYLNICPVLLHHVSAVYAHHYLLLKLFHCTSN
jgi:hypothetical protein